jgi:hypothetical protein
VNLNQLGLAPNILQRWYELKKGLSVQIAMQILNYLMLLKMKIEDLKPGDRLWVKGGVCWHKGRFVGGFMAWVPELVFSEVDLRESEFCERTEFTLWEKIVDLFFKRK